MFPVIKLNFYVYKFRQLRMKFGLLLSSVSAIETCFEPELAGECALDCDSDYYSCVVSCEDDADCKSACIRQLDVCQRSCPCAEECPNGCTDCSNPVCQMKTVVSLNTYGSNNAFLINEEIYDTKINFSYGDQTEVYYSCYTVFQGQKYIFGGEENPRQRSIIPRTAKTNDCALSRIDKQDLPFDFYEGACLNMNNEYLLLCFDHENNRQCYRFVLKLFEQNLLTVDHRCLTRVFVKTGSTTSYRKFNL